MAVAQAPGVRLAQWQETLLLIDDLLAQAAARAAELVVLPECVWPAYCIGSQEAYFAARRAGLPGPEAFVLRLQDSARRHRLAICAGYIDERGETLLNAAALIEADGTLRGVRHKCFLWAFDRRYFAPGRRLSPVPLGAEQAGLLVCADARLPEVPATLVTRGARICLQPTAWVHVGDDSAPPWNPQPAFLIAARAAELGVPFASASKWGREEGTLFVGQSLLCDARGNILAQCGDSETGIAVAELEPRPPRAPRVSDPERSVLLSDQRPGAPTADVPPLELWLLADNATLAQTSPAGPGRARLGLRRPDGQSDAPAIAAESTRGLELAGVASSGLELMGIELATFRAPDADCFAPMRAAVLRGLHVAVVFGAEATLLQLRARACENRVYVVWVRSQGVCVIDTGGNIVTDAAWPASGAAQAAVLDTPQAAKKEFAWDTNLLNDRQPEAYAF